MRGGSIYIDQAKTKSKKKEKRRNEKPRFLFPFLSAAPVREVSQEPFFLGGERKDRFCRLVPIQIHARLYKDSGEGCLYFWCLGNKNASENPQFALHAPSSRSFA